jgi:Cytochrome P460
VLPFVTAFLTLVKSGFLEGDRKAQAHGWLRIKERPMRLKATSVYYGLGVAAAALAWSFCIGAQADDGAIRFPEGYRRWVHVKSTLIGPSSPAFAVNGGVHHFYANDKALDGYRSGSFPDGSTIIDDGLEAKENAGVTSDGPRRRVAVMVKESQRYRETGGWGFEVFKGDGRDPSLDSATRAVCFACHKNGRDSVFSEWRE